MTWDPHDTHPQAGYDIKSLDTLDDDPKDENKDAQMVTITASVKILLRCWVVHLVPITISVIIIFFNLKGSYLGADLMSPIKSETANLMLLQVASKAHEAMIMISIGLILLQLVRNEGITVFGPTFTDLSLFLNKKFHGSVDYKGEKNGSRKIKFVTSLVVAGLTAVLAGLASSVLLAPKSQDWKIGGTQFYLNGSASNFWPADLSGDMSELRPFCDGSDSTRLGICPAGGFQALWDHWGSQSANNFRGDTLRPYSKRLSGSNFYWPVSSPSSQIPPLYALGNAKDGDNGATSLIQTHAASAVVLQRLATDWWQALKARTGLPSDQVDDRVASADFKNAISVVKCASPQELSASDTIVDFPSLDGRFDFANNIPLVLQSLNHTAANHLRFQWVHLPAKYGAATIGGVFETPWKFNNTSRAVIACTVQAGWVPATVSTDKYTFWSGWYPWNIQFGDRTPQWSATEHSSTNGRISFGDDWLDLLTPPTSVPDKPSWRPSTIESIFLNAGLDTSSENVAADWLGSNSGSQDKLALIEAIVCSVVVDGLSRTGSYRVFNISGSSSAWPLANYNPLPSFETEVLRNKPALEVPAIDSETLTTIEARMKISGFSFQRSLLVYISMVVLLVHICMAAIHMYLTFMVERQGSVSGYP
ncbi:hypothetical protein MYU51_005669 [Penicillium brevicompactum]